LSVAFSKPSLFPEILDLTVYDLSNISFNVSVVAAVVMVCRRRSHL